jgi:DNA-directed RNA polymerase specialized sigma24 family protein
MEANLRSVPAGPAEEADIGETAPSFEEFYKATFRRLFTALWLVTGNRHEVEEVAQEAFVRVFERWDRVGLLEDTTGYLFRVSMNVFRSRSRRGSERDLVAHDVPRGKQDRVSGRQLHLRGRRFDG